MINKKQSSDDDQLLDHLTKKKQPYKLITIFLDTKQTIFVSINFSLFWNGTIISFMDALNFRT